MRLFSRLSHLSNDAHIAVLVDIDNLAVLCADKDFFRGEANSSHGWVLIKQYAFALLG